MRGILTGRRGLAPALLAVVVVFALVAVLLLTGTITSAQRIDRDVKVIKPEVGDIRSDTKNIELAKETTRISARIAETTQPLSGELQSTLRQARMIDGTAKSILLRAFSINNTANAINANVRQINATVHGIDADATAINANAQAINASARSINASARGINTKVRGINSDVRGIRSSAGGILSTVRSIDGRVSGINDRAVAARGVISLIGGDLQKILDGALSINRHANEIDCSNLINNNILTQPPPDSTGCVR